MVDVWPLLAAYTDLAERHAALLVERLESTLARAKADREARVAADVRAIMQDVEAALEAMPAPKLF
jgi:hypothetical protein